MAYLLTVVPAAISANQFTAQHTFPAVCPAKLLASGKFSLNLIPLVRLDNCGMASFHIILRNFPFIWLHLFLQKIHSELFL